MSEADVASPPSCNQRPSHQLSLSHISQGEAFRFIKRVEGTCPLPAIWQWLMVRLFVRSFFLARLGEFIIFSTLFTIGSRATFPFPINYYFRGIAGLRFGVRVCGRATEKEARKMEEIKLEAKRGERMSRINYTSIACLSICTLIINKTSPCKRLQAFSRCRAVLENTVKRTRNRLRHVKLVNRRCFPCLFCFIV